MVLDFVPVDIMGRFGATPETSTASHEYTTGGIFEVIVTVRDDDAGQNVSDDSDGAHDAFFSDLGDDTTDGGSVVYDGAGQTLLCAENIN